MQKIQLLQSAIFRHAYKKLHSNQKADVDNAVAEIVYNPTIGEAKVMCTCEKLI
jgi:mRNA interferase RelE/StbE